ncbi:MAG: PorV/PorQ family protein [Candidatus Cloacimonadales bacterium]
MKKIGIILAIILMAAAIRAETSGEYGMQVLKLIVSADEAAMGGTGAFYANHAARFVSNPAAANLDKFQALSFNQNYWIFDTTINSLNYLKSSGKSSFGIGYRYLDYGALPGATDDGQLTGDFYPMDLVVSAGAAYRLSPNHFVGANLNGLYQKIDIESALGGSLDLGYRYLSPLRGIELAAALKNLGKTGKLGDEDIKLPLSAEFSLIAKELNRYLALDDLKLSSELKIVQHIDNDELEANLGLKALVHPNFSLKSGYVLNHDIKSWSAGFGLRMKRILVDYAFLPISGEIDDVHMIQLTYRF